MDINVSSQGYPPMLPEKNVERMLTSKRSAPNLRIDIRSRTGDSGVGVGTVDDNARSFMLNRPRLNSTAATAMPSPLTPFSNLVKDMKSQTPQSLTVAKHARGRSHDSINSIGKEHERDSGAYFRRISLLPPSNRNLSYDDATVIDSSRGILFALSQVFTATKQYITLASDERLSGVVNRVLVSGNHQLGQFVLALEKFDSSTIYKAPGPKLTKDVLQACSMSVSTFRKILSVLQLQLAPLTKSADVRYSRTLILLLHGAMNEIRLSWAKLGPVITRIEKVMTEDSPSSASTTSSFQSTASQPPPAMSVRSIASRPALKHQNSSASLFSLHNAPALSPIPSASTPISPYTNVSNANSLPDHVQSPVIHSMALASTSTMTTTAVTHNRNISISSQVSPLIPIVNTGVAPSAAAAAATSDTDRHLFDLVDSATVAATKVLQSIVNEPWISSPKSGGFPSSPNNNGSGAAFAVDGTTSAEAVRGFKELSGACSEVTRRLMHSFAVIQSGGKVGSARNGRSANATTRTFLDDLQAFVRAVIHLSTYAKRLTEMSNSAPASMSANKPSTVQNGQDGGLPMLSKETKQNLATLARSTRELTILFSLSSFRSPPNVSHGHSSSVGSGISTVTLAGQPYIQQSYPPPPIHLPPHISPSIAP